MITAIEISKALSDRLRSLGYPIKAVDLAEEIPRPCLVVEVDSITDRPLGIYNDERLEFAVYYFASKRQTGYGELLQLQAQLMALCREPLQVAEGFYITPQELDFELSREDMCLICSMTLQTVQELHKEPDAETMEELGVRF